MIRDVDDAGRWIKERPVELLELVRAAADATGRRDSLERHLEANVHAHWERDDDRWLAGKCLYDHS